MKRQIDVGALYAALESKREADGRSWRDIATELDVSPSTFTRLGQGKGTDVNTFVTLAGWLGVPTEHFISGEAAPAEDETLEAISSYLRADRNLKPRSAQAIETVLRAAYEQLAEPPQAR